MGVVVKQSVSNSVSLLLGLILGALSTLVIYPMVFPEGDSAKDWGIIQLILSYATIGSEFLSLGSSRVVVYFHNRIDSDKRDYLNSFIWLYPGILVLIIGAILVIYPGVFSYFVADEYAAERLKDFVFPTMVILLSSIYFSTAAGYSAAHMRTSMQAFLTEVFIRVGVIGWLFVFHLGHIGFEALIYGYATIYALRMIVQVVSLNSAAFRGTRICATSWRKIKEYFTFGAYAMLDSAAAMLVNRMDMVMIGAYMSADNVAYYTIALFMATVILIPSRALIPISSSILAKAWSENDLDTIRSVYRKSALNQMIFGGIVFVVLWASIADLESLLPKDYQSIQEVFLYLSIAKLVHMSFGINGGILLTSSKFRVSFYLNLFLMVFTFGSNLILIPEMGSEGAALATLISVCVFNVLRYFYLLWKWKFQPFHAEHLTAILLLIFLFVSGELLHVKLGYHVVWDVVLRSVILGGASLGLTYALKLSPEFNGLVRKFLPNRPM